MVERWTFNPTVVGSTPTSGGLIFFFFFSSEIYFLLLLQPVAATSTPSNAASTTKSTNSPADALVVSASAAATTPLAETANTAKKAITKTGKNQSLIEKSASAATVIQLDRKVEFVMKSRGSVLVKKVLQDFLVINVRRDIISRKI